MRRESAKIHWVFILFIVLLAVFAAVAFAPIVSEMRRPPYEVKALRFMELIRQNQFPEAAKLLDMESVPEAKRDPKKVLEERMPLWGTMRRSRWWRRFKALPI